MVAEEPQVPLTIKGAEQLAVVPPLEPSQVQAHGPEPVTSEAEPVEQMLAAGLAETLTPLADPQVPLTGVASLAAVQVGEEAPPLEPWQVQVEELPDAGKATVAGLVIPFPAWHIVPVKDVSV